ncbi:retrovirus-related pol polyprotein from transposon TNT 1-94 [Tanacetum coccineum]
MAEDDKIKIDKFDGYDFRQALGVVRLSLAKNVAYNIVNEKTTYGLFKALSNMYDKPSPSNKVFLIRQLVNTKMKEGASIADHVNEFNSNLSRFMSVDIKFDDEVQALLLLSLLPERWSGTVTAVSGSTGTTKLKFNNIRDLILREDIRRKKFGEYSNSLLCAEDKGRGRKQDRGQKQNRGISKSKKREELERFKLCSDKVHLANDKTLDIAGVGGGVLKTSFGYNVGFGDQQWKVTKGSLVVAHGNKRRSLYMVEVPSDGINVAINGRGNASLWHQRLGHMSEKGMKILDLKGMIPYLQKAVVGFCEPCILGKQKKNGVAKRMNRTLNERANSIRLHAGFPEMFWEDSVTTTAYLINHAPSVPLGFQIPKEEWQGKEVSLAYLKAKAATDSSNLTKPNKRDQVVLEDFPKNLANKSVVAEHGFSLEIT